VVGRRWTKLGATLVLCLLAAPACRRETTPRWLILLTCDTLRADRLGAYGGSPGLTPNLDALLEESLVFRAAFAPAAYTLPSLSALMTGRHPEELGMLENVSELRTETSLASVLRLHGWRTGAVVSNYVLRKGTGMELGFEYYDDTYPQSEANRDLPERIASDTTAAALAMVERLRTEPATSAFLWVHYQDPHGPYLPPDGRRERYLELERRAPDGRRQLAARPMMGVASIPLYQYVQGEHEVAFYRAGYAGEIDFFDHEIGRLLTGLEERGIGRDAIVVFTADHGEALGENDYWFAHGEYLTDPLVRVPLGIRVPDGAPGQRSDPAALVDLFPTLLHLVGIGVPSDPPGRDLLAPGAAHARPEIYLAALRGATVPRYGLVADGYKYLLSEEPEGRREELYALGKESRDLSVEQAETLGEMRARLERIRGGLRRPIGERRQQLTPAESERLRRLGYVVD
jgi:arylsulfatase